VYRSWQGEIGCRNEGGLQLFEVKEQHDTRNGGALKQIKEINLKGKKEGKKQ
jgi:hypothetical protein